MMTDDLDFAETVAVISIPSDQLNKTGHLKKSLRKHLISYDDDG